MPGIQDCPRNNSGTTPCKGRRRFGAELWLCCSHSSCLPGFLSNAALTLSWVSSQLLLLLECLIPVPAFQNFHSSALPDLFCAAFSGRNDRRVSPGFGSSTVGVCFDLHRVLEDWNSALDEGSPHALIWDVLISISWHVVAFFFPLCISFLWPLCHCVFNVCYLTEITVCRQHLEQGMPYVFLGYRSFPKVFP